jgi:hypothetical protein
MCSCGCDTKRISTGTAGLTKYLVLVVERKPIKKSSPGCIECEQLALENPIDQHGSMNEERICTEITDIRFRESQHPHHRFGGEVNCCSIEELFKAFHACK